MTKENREITSRLIQYLIDFPEMRFGQALFNLGINQFANQTNPQEANYLLKDIYNDENKKIIERMNTKKK